MRIGNTRIKKIAAVLAAVLFMFPVNAFAATDEREFAHGMNYVKNPVTGKAYLIWSDAYKSGVMKNGSWTHDVFIKQISANAPSAAGKRRLIGAYEAQEPASASVSGDGKMIVTFEDGNDAGTYTLAQRFAVYDKKMKVLKKYPATIAMGGHSGHASSTNNRHVVFWNEGWVDGGGADGLGTGDDLYVTSLRTDGSHKKTIKVCADDRTRDWWPVSASSDSKTLLVWQRYVDGETYSHLCYALFDPVKCRLVKTYGEDGAFSKIHEITDIKLKYYSYNVAYSGDCFIIALTGAEGGASGRFISISENGSWLGAKEGFPALAREASPALKKTGSGALLCYPTSSGGAVFVYEKGGNVSLIKLCDGSVKWSYRGTSGFFGKGNTAYFASLGRQRASIKRFTL